MRHAWIALGALVLPLATARPAPAEEAAALPPLTRTDLELLPFEETDRHKFLRDHGAFVFRVDTVLRRLERVEQQLAERAQDEKKVDAGALALTEERARLLEQAAALVPEIESTLAAAGVPDGALARARRAPRGPLRVDRFGHALVLEVPDLTPAQRARLELLVPQVDGAVLALDAASRRLRKADRDAEVGPAAHADEYASGLDRRRRGVEERFWRLVYWLLDEDQRAALMARMPHELRKREDGIGHVYLVKGLTPSQGIAFKALLLEVEAESAADGAEVKRAVEALAKPGLSPDERKLHEKAKSEAEGRLVDLQVRARDHGVALFTPEQVREIRALPPYLSAAERREAVTKTVESLVLTPEQRLALAAMTKRYEAEKIRIQSGYLAVKRRLDEAGPDSPERDMAEMMAATFGADVAAALRSAHGELFLTILSPAQVEGWVLGV